MRGFQNYNRNNLVAGDGYLLVFWTLLFLGCSGTEEVVRLKSADGTLHEFLAQHEQTFRPSDYKLEFKLIREEEEKRYSEIHTATVYTTTVPETIPGFRVQVLLTQEIDEANTALANLEQQLPEDFAYMVYDAPYYKIRVGNFHQRTTANTILKKLSELGYKEAWIVPDNILKNPPPRPPNINIEPEKFINNNR